MNRCQSVHVFAIFLIDNSDARSIIAPSPSPWISDFTCRCVLIFGGWNAAGGLPRLTCDWPVSNVACTNSKRFRAPPLAFPIIGQCTVNYQLTRTLLCLLSSRTLVYRMVLVKQVKVTEWDNSNRIHLRFTSLQLYY